MSLAALVICLSLLPAALADETQQTTDAPVDAASQGADRFAPEQVRFFESRVQPILKTHCLKCHGGGSKLRGGLRLTSRAHLLRGGDSGPAVDLDNPDESVLLEAVNYQTYEMPPSGKLDPEEIAVLTEWVRQGLPWTPGQTGAPQPEPEESVPHVNATTKAFWSFRSIERPAVPEVQGSDWVRNPIDAFILEKLEARGLSPAPPADRVALLRRAYYDLTGLPPTPEEVDAFLADESPDAYERAIDRLLDSKRYGEHWGRHWLDLVRYAETNSFERDAAKPNAWRYRDYVIESFNADKPYDQFLREQLAGDELDTVTPETIIATGYYRLCQWDDEPSDPLQARYDELDDILATTSQVFLGLTMNCARCHDHKLDPIPQRDYYRMLAFFHGLHSYGTRGDQTTHSQTDISDRGLRDQYRMRDEELRRLRAAMKPIEQAGIVKMSAEDQRKSETRERAALLEEKLHQYLDDDQWKQYSELKAQLAAVESIKLPPRTMALSVNNCMPDPPPTHVLVRGNAHVRGDVVEPGFPDVLGFPDPEIPPPGPNAKSSGRRRVLAEWIASEENPLTARVMANRIWQYHFGRGLVRSPNNFGLQGDKPTHPGLLDWLAAELMARGWRLKALHRLVMTSSAYRMPSQSDPKALAADPENDLFWRFDMRRLAAEEIRDSILAVNGTLNLKMGGPSIYPEMPKAVLAGQSRPGHGWGKSSESEQARRSVYIHLKRSLILPILASFDFADTEFSCPVRFATTQPTQALTMLNSAFLNEEAGKFADRVRREAGPKRDDQVRRALRLALSRPCRNREVRRGVEFLEALETHDGLSPDTALTHYCLLVLNLNEFMYLD